MTPRVRTHLIIITIAAMFVGLGLVNPGDPYLRGTSANYDETLKSWTVSGELVYPSSATLNFPGGHVQVMERVVPFALAIPDSSGKVSYGERILPLAIAASKGTAGHRNLNVPALAGGWLVCYATLWLSWWLFRR